MDKKTNLARSGQFVEDIVRHEIFSMSGALAYTTALAIAPLFVIVLAALTFLDAETQTLMSDRLQEILGSDAGNMLQIIVAQAKNETTYRGISGVLSVLVLVFSASTIFAQLRIALDKINEHVVNPEVSTIWLYVRRRFFSILLALGFVLVLIASLSVSTALATVSGKDSALIWKLVSVIFDLSIFATLFSLMFQFTPSDRFGWKRCIKSGVSATIFFLVGKHLISYYLGHSAIGSPYGAAGSLAILLVWLYYTAVTILISYEFTHNLLGPPTPNVSTT